MCDALTACLLVLALVIVAALALRRRSERRGGRRGERYLVAPYLDLDEPGERGSYYALTPQ